MVGVHWIVHQQSWKDRPLIRNPVLMEKIGWSMLNLQVLTIRNGNLGRDVFVLRLMNPSNLYHRASDTGKQRDDRQGMARLQSGC